MNQQPGDADLDAILRTILRSEADAVRALAENLPESATRAVHLLAACRGRVIVTGMGKMSAVARKFAAMLCSTGTPAGFMHPSEANHGDLGMVTSSDLLVALSNSGETCEVLSLIPFMKRHRVPVIAVTGSTENSLARNADCAIPLNVRREADPITEAPTNSTTAALALCDALAVGLIHLRGVTREQFALFHPGGQLGRKMLLKVSDLMHRDERLPLVPMDATLRDAIVIISRMGLGAGLVCNGRRMAGILTDGDLRRLLENHDNPLRMPVRELMNPHPVSIRGDQLAVEAINLMRERAITVLPVVRGEDDVEGILHLHDLLRAGLG